MSLAGGAIRPSLSAFHVATVAGRSGRLVGTNAHASPRVGWRFGTFLTSSMGRPSAGRLVLADVSSVTFGATFDLVVMSRRSGFRTTLASGWLGVQYYRVKAIPALPVNRSAGRRPNQKSQMTSSQTSPQMGLKDGRGSDVPDLPGLADSDIRREGREASFPLALNSNGRLLRAILLRPAWTENTH